MAVLLIVCKSLVIHTLSWVVHTPDAFQRNSPQTHQVVAIAKTTARFIHQLIDDFKNYLDNHPYSSPISSSTFTSLLVLYYENTYVQLTFSPVVNVVDTSDHYQNLYHYLFLAKIPHPPQIFGSFSC